MALLWVDKFFKITFCFWLIYIFQEPRLSVGDGPSPFSMGNGNAGRNGPHGVLNSRHNSVFSEGGTLSSRVDWNLRQGLSKILYYTLLYVWPRLILRVSQSRFDVLTRFANDDRKRFFSSFNLKSVISMREWV